MGMGTDSGTPMNFHSEALWREIKVHVDMGMTPMRAIAAATRVNAQIIGKPRDLGSIEPGKIADIIVVNGNPLFDITALVARRNRRQRRPRHEDQGPIGRVRCSRRQGYIVPLVVAVFHRVGRGMSNGRA